MNEFNLTADGPILHLPGGELKAAIGALYTGTNYSNLSMGTNANSNAVLNVTQANGTRYVGSTYFELAIPVFGENFTLPFVKRLNFELASRYDNYNQFGETWNPKASGDWTLGWGFTLKGSVGTSFRAPSFQENANGGAGAVNSAVGTGAANSVGTCPVVGVPAVAGSIAAIIDPNCSQALQFLGGLSLFNSAQSAAAIRPGGVNLTPEKGYSVDYGIEFRPTYRRWRPVRLLERARPAGDLLEPASGQQVAGLFRLGGGHQRHPGQPGLHAGLPHRRHRPAVRPARGGFGQQPVLQPSGDRDRGSANNLASNVAFIADGAIRNIGWQYVDGIDLQAEYRWRLDGYKGWAPAPRMQA